MDPVNLLPFLLLGTTFGARLLGIGYGLGGIQGGMLAARRVQSVLDEPELTVREGSPPATSDATVVFSDVTFGYRPEVPVIKNVSLTLRPGTVTALVGPSGSGQVDSGRAAGTFPRCAAGGDQRRRRATSGRCPPTSCIAGSASYCRKLSWCTAAPPRTSRLAQPDADADAITAAARDAQIHERIERLPDGYDTVLGAGAGLSGGERQRLTIARALLADTPVLILDEATAFADPESEYLVQQALNRLTQDRTVLVIAHRLHTITHADQIVVLDDGEIAETGSHDDLLAAGGRYRTLWDSGRPVSAGARRRPDDPHPAGPHPRRPAWPGLALHRAHRLLGAVARGRGGAAGALVAALFSDTPPTRGRGWAG